MLWLAAVARVAPDALRPELALALPLGLLAGYLLADLLTGAVHWLADRCFDPGTPLLGPLLIAPFRAHHDDPTSIARHALHHRGDHDRAYCVTSGWLNPVLDGVGLFPRLERWLAGPE